MDAVFFAQLGCSSVFENTATSRAVLQKVRDVVEEGFAGRHLQRLPHITLLNKDFYTARMRPVMAEWASLWLLKHHLHGISTLEAVTYILEGGTARSEAGIKLRAIEAAIHRRTDVEPTSELAAAQARRDSAFDTRRRAEEVHQLHEAAAFAARQISAVEKVYDYEAAALAKQRLLEEKLARLETVMGNLSKEIKQLEYPRDTSLDNMVIVMLSSHFAETADGTKSTTPPKSGAELQMQTYHLQMQTQNIQQQMQKISQSPGYQTDSQKQSKFQELQQQMQELQMLQQRLSIEQQMQQQQMRQTKRKGRKSKKAQPSTANQPVSASPVLDLCAALEGLGFTVSRCYKSEEAISKAHALQQNHQLRCVITDSASRGAKPADVAAAAAAAAEATCSYCNQNGHSAFQCPHLRQQGIKDPADTSDIQDFVGMHVVNQLMEPVQHQEGRKGLTNRRVAVMDDILKMGAAGRKKCWTEDIAVFSSSTDCVAWVRDLPDWDRSEDRETSAVIRTDMDASFFIDDDSSGSSDDGPEPSAGPPLQRQRSVNAIRLSRLRTRLDQLDMKKRQILAVAEKEVRDTQHGLAERSSAFYNIVQEREQLLQSALADAARFLVGSTTGGGVQDELLATPCCGRDAALALAWLVRSNLTVLFIVLVSTLVFIAQTCL
jgi:hypothetical protein